MSDEAKILAFFQEFPWLENFYAPDEISAIFVQRVDRDLLTARISTKAEGGKREEFFLLDRDGELLGRVGVKSAPTWWRRNRQVRFRETVGDAILRFGAAGRLQFVLEQETVVDETYDCLRRCLTIHKPPKDFTAQEWLDEELRRARAAIQAEIAAIDANGARPK